MSAAIDVPRITSVEPGGAQREAFVQAMRGAVTGVNVVATDGPIGRFGLTVSAFCSVSADPPTVLVCINRQSPLRAAIMANQRFSVNVLSAEQRPLAETFAGLSKHHRPYEFDPQLWEEGASGSPVLTDAVANFDCTLELAIPSGSHAIFFGRVIAVNRRPATPLIYTNRTYGRPAELDA